MALQLFDLDDVEMQLTSHHKDLMNCVFYRVSTCRDQVVPYICNNHAALFGLEYRMVNYTNGENESWTRYVTYAVSTGSICIPTFEGADRAVNANDVRAFTLNISNQFPNINVRKLDRVLETLLGINTVSLDNCIRTWLDEASTRLIYRTADGPRVYEGSLPLLHRILFSYCKPSNVQSGRSYIYSIPNLIITQDDITKKKAFVVPNKSILLKMTDKPNCVATPLVLEAIRVITDAPTLRSFNPINVNC